MEEGKGSWKAEIEEYLNDLFEVEKSVVPEERRYKIDDETHPPQPEGFWKTGTSQHAPHRYFIRGYPLEEITGNLTYTEALFLDLVGRLPEKKETIIFDALLTSIIDGQMGGANIGSIRYTASGNPQFIPALTAGILTIGANTVSPFLSAELIDRAWALMKNEDLTYEETAKRIISEFRAEKKRVPGFGHPTNRKFDPRTVSLFKIANKMGILGEKTRMYFAIHKEFETAIAKGRDIPINVDGAIAIIFAELEWGSPFLTLATAMMSLMPGMIAQTIEELENPVPLRIIYDSEYVGAPPRALPEGYKGRDK